MTNISLVRIPKIYAHQHIRWVQWAYNWFWTLLTPNAIAVHRRKPTTKFTLRIRRCWQLSCRFNVIQFIHTAHNLKTANKQKKQQDLLQRPNKRIKWKLQKFGITRRNNLWNWSINWIWMTSRVLSIDRMSIRLNSRGSASIVMRTTKNRCISRKYLIGIFVGAVCCLVFDSKTLDFISRL